MDVALELGQEGMHIQDVRLADRAAGAVGRPEVVAVGRKEVARGSLSGHARVFLGSGRTRHQRQRLRLTGEADELDEGDSLALREHADAVGGIRLTAPRAAGTQQSHAQSLLRIHLASLAERRSRGRTQTGLE